MKLIKLHPSARVAAFAVRDSGYLSGLRPRWRAGDRQFAFGAAIWKFCMNRPWGLAAASSRSTIVR